MTAGRYSRRVSALERYSLVLNAVYRYHVDGVLEGQGEVSPQKLQEAVNRAAAANTGIRVRFRGFLAFSRWVDSGIAPQVRVMPLSDWDGASEQGAPFLEEKLAPRRGMPIADVLLVPCRDGATRIVFRTLHAAIDGRGCLHWIGEVCRALRGEPLLGSDSRLTDLDVQEQYKAQIPTEPETPPPACIPVLQPSPQEHLPLRFVWRRVIIDRNVSNLLTKAAAFLAQWARRQQTGPVGFTIPVDYRGFRVQEMGVGNLTGYVRLSVDEQATPRSLVQQLNQRLKAFADCRQFPGVRVLFWLPVWFMTRQLRPKIDAILHTVTPALPSGGVVSMGNVKAEQFHFPGFTATRLFGIPGAVGKLNLVFINYPDHIAACFAAPAAYNHDGQLDELVAAFRQHFSQSGSTP
ncbi:hypothetical protein SAMN04488038_103210 [Solimonas aquatica]|uniref:Condensation domain-containing protein n=1 Tax=Solimonas aquatica TaxID=489703 RepID=A0A1H9CWJ6_9GAMM|nr:hypothetical protein [Solimonas aquatica]SEQ05590.1 hypothetical protein SAMN04488038_103210 [Solimonas aquatica]